MAAGAAGYGEVYTPEAAKALNARGDEIRERLNAICAEAEARSSSPASARCSRCTSRASDAHRPTWRGATRSEGTVLLRHVAAGIWIARRGLVALNITIGDAEGDRSWRRSRSSSRHERLFCGHNNSLHRRHERLLHHRASRSRSPARWCRASATSRPSCACRCSATRPTSRSAWSACRGTAARPTGRAPATVRARCATSRP